MNERPIRPIILSNILQASLKTGNMRVTTTGANALLSYVEILEGNQLSRDVKIDDNITVKPKTTFSVVCDDVGELAGELDTYEEAEVIGRQISIERKMDSVRGGELGEFIMSNAATLNKLMEHPALVKAYLASLSMEKK